MAARNFHAWVFLLFFLLMSLSAVTHHSDWVPVILTNIQILPHEKSRGVDRIDRSELAKTHDPINQEEFLYESPISGQSMEKETSRQTSCLVMKTWKQEPNSVNVIFYRFGGTEAGTFCALSTLAEQVQHDNSVDVYMVGKLYHLKRPGIFSSQVRAPDKGKVQPPLLNAFFAASRL